jgi:hypothetical protein
MTKEDGEREAIRRWLLLPEHMRQSYEDAEAFAKRLVIELNFPTVTSRERLIAAWLMRELFRSRAAEKDAEAA